MPGFNIQKGDPATALQANIETARVHRWRWETLKPTPEVATILVFAYKSGRPSPEIDRVVVHHGHTEFYEPGKFRWRPIEISFYEGLQKGVDSVAKAIYEWWGKATVNLKRGCAASTEASSETLPGAEGTLVLQDGSGTTVWAYRLYGSWPSQVTPCELDYASSKIADITVTLQMAAAEEAKNF
jgi:hypothetical protein